MKYSDSVPVHILRKKTNKFCSLFVLLDVIYFLWLLSRSIEGLIFCPYFWSWKSQKIHGIYFVKICGHPVIVTEILGACAAPFVQQLFRRVVHSLIWQPWVNLLKDQAILDIRQCYLNINYVWQSFLVQTRRSDIWSEQTNTKQRIWKTVVAIKK